MYIFAIIFLVLGLVLGLVGFVVYRGLLRRAKGIERGLKMVPLLIHLPPVGNAPDTGTRDSRDVMREKVSQAATLYDLIAGIAQSGFKSKFYGQRHIAFEIIAKEGRIFYYAAVPVALVSVVQQAILTAYPAARLEETEDYNIFSPTGKLAGTSGGELVLKKAAPYPIATIEKVERDPMEAIINALSGLQPGEGAAVQIMLRPANKAWIKQAVKLVKLKKARVEKGLQFTAADLAKAAVKAPKSVQEQQAKPLSGLEQSAVDAIEEKTRHAAYEVLIRVVVSAETTMRSQMVLKALVATFALFDDPALNGFKFLPAANIEGLVTAFIFRFFPPELNSDVLNSQELAAVFHLPDSQTPVSDVMRQASKQVDAPAMLPSSGLLLGYNAFRGEQKEVRLTPEDRRRHTYIVGQTGTGKSVLLENLAVQDMLEGNGFAFVDPHGDTVEKLIGMVPKNRAEDVIYFNPGDTEYPLGLNLFEFSVPEQKDFLIQETINMLYKIYDPGKTGIIGPRFEQWFRNAALTLMSDPNGSTFIEVPNIFTDAEFLKRKFKYLQDPTVIDFWTKEMAQTSDYHKSEMLGWFNSKFGAFQQNEIMRNIIGQSKSAFNMREIMDQRKILLVNLSKGKIGELNSSLLGMMFVIKFQAAAMSRAAVPESERPDFCLYVDEFQNFSTDSFASILSEARKYHLNLIVANQFIGQLSDSIKDAVFGNVGTIISFRCGPEDADFLVKQFAPSFDSHDLVNLQLGNAVARLLVGGLPSQPFSMATLPPLQLSSPELGLAVKQLSAAKFGRPRALVEADVFGRMKGEVVPPVAASKPEPATIHPPTQMTNLSAQSEASIPAVQAQSAPSQSAIAQAAPATLPVSSAKPIQGALSVADIVRDMPLQTAANETQIPPEPNAATANISAGSAQTMKVDDVASTHLEASVATASSQQQSGAGASHDTDRDANNSLASLSQGNITAVSSDIVEEVKSAGLDKLIQFPGGEPVKNEAKTIPAPGSINQASTTHTTALTQHVSPPDDHKSVVTKEAELANQHQAPKNVPALTKPEEHGGGRQKAANGNHAGMPTKTDTGQVKQATHEARHQEPSTGHKSGPQHESRKPASHPSEQHLKQTVQSPAPRKVEPKHVGSGRQDDTKTPTVSPHATAAAHRPEKHKLETERHAVSRAHQPRPKVEGVMPGPSKKPSHIGASVSENMAHGSGSKPAEKTAAATNDASQSPQQKVAPSAPSGPSVPAISPGEVYVDEQGVVHFG
jgi:hypothetical protein